VATLSAEEEFAFFASRRNAAIRDGIILSVAIVGFVSIVGAGLSYYVSRDLTNRRRGEEAVRQSEARYRSLFEDSPIALVELDLSALRQHIDGLRHAGVNDLASHLEARPDELRDCLARLRSVDANRAALELYEAETKEELLSNWPQVSTEETFGLVQRAFAGAAVREGTLDAETTGRTLRGKIIDLSVHLSIAPGYERTWEKAILSLADISERQRAEQARARLTAILEATPDFVGSATPDGHLRYLNRAARSAIGVDEEFDVTELKMTDAHPDWTNDILFNEAIPAAIRDGFWSGEGAWLSRDGTETPTSMVLLSHKKSNGEVELLSTISRDITDRKTLEEQLAHAANYDPLTNLPNRRQFERALERALRDARLYGKNGALLFLDLDHFKDVNDSLGHRAGDELLSALARLLRENLRAGDLLARVGGDEFTLLLPDTTLDRATGVAEKVRQVLHGHMFSINGQAIAMTGSVGIAFFPEHGSRPDELLARADLAMYQAKEDGRDRLCVFAPDRDWEAQTKSRLNWRNLIHDALENDRFTLHAQPILNVRTGRTSQYELLLRMIGPDDTTLLPADFLHIAERSGSIQPRERWVVR
ncbi:MAG: diguanylate cyclase, partial [Dehalococcoidia bacterium]|nr:diguanylate cyclase [Dehalococcoidia bacterium]